MTDPARRQAKADPPPVKSGHPDPIIPGQEAMPWADKTAPDRLPPRECIWNAREALNKAYSHPGISDGRHALVFIAEAVDWQRRALGQMVTPNPKEAPHGR